MNTLLENIAHDIDVRQSLSKLRQLVKSPQAMGKFIELLDTGTMDLSRFLDSDDAKTRKNAVLLMGDTGLSTYASTIYEYYKKETALFVKGSYLSALKNMDYMPFLEDMKSTMNELSSMTLDDSNRKHISEEMKILSELIIAVEGIDTHKFTGYNLPLELILLTNRNHKELLEAQVEELGELEPFPAGVRITTTNLKTILELRTYRELLFIIKDIPECPNDAISAAAKIANSSFLAFLEATHSNNNPFYFRVELKTKMPLDIKSAFAKKFSSELERSTNRQLINSTTSYEIEIRLIETKTGTFNVLIKLLTIPDHRFEYRKEHVSASIKPSDAALLVELARNYMLTDAQVLDPFCGVGTMLIERQMVVKANTSYGIDIYPDAIKKARINTDAAHQIIHYINKDYFRFTHEYLFDEIFTNMPYLTNHKTTEDIASIYNNFFSCSRKLLKEDGTIIIYSHNKPYVKKLASTYDYSIIQEFCIMDKADTYLFIIRYNH